MRANGKAGAQDQLVRCYLAKKSPAAQHTLQVHSCLAFVQVVHKPREDAGLVAQLLLRWPAQARLECARQGRRGEGLLRIVALHLVRHRPAGVLCCCKGGQQWRRNDVDLRQWMAMQMAMQMALVLAVLLAASGTPTHPHAHPQTPTHSRRVLLRRAGALAASAPFASSRAAPRPYPSADDVRRELVDADWSDGWPFNKASFERYDESADDLFYSEPRLVYHVDAPAVLAIKRHYAAVLEQAGGLERPLDVLDVASSWVSFLPAAYKGDAAASRVVGVGLNRAELAANPQLTEWRVQDLNREPSLGWLPTASFDAAFCTVSVDYLTRPRELFAEVARVLRPGAPFVVAFSDRVFFEKAVAHWTGRSDLDHVDAVGAYFHFASSSPGRAGGVADSSLLFDAPEAVRIDTAPRDGIDPVIVVSARRCAPVS